MLLVVCLIVQMLFAGRSFRISRSPIHMPAFSNFLQTGHVGKNAANNMISSEYYQTENGLTSLEIHLILCVLHVAVSSRNTRQQKKLTLNCDIPQNINPINTPH